MATILTQKECPSCGAPLSVDETAASVQCTYCGTTIQVERGRPPRAPDPVAPPTVYVAKGLPKIVVLGIAASALVPLGITTMTVFGSAITNQVKSASGSFPMDCGNGDELHLVGKTYSGTGPLVRAGLNCKVFIQDCQLSADVIVEGTLNDEITIEHSTLEATEAVVRLQTNGVVNASRSSALRSKAVAISGGVNTKLVLTDVEVRGDRAAILGEVNTEIRATRTTIAGHDAAISVRTNGHVFGTGLTVTADVTGIDADQNLELSLEQSTIDGGNAGVQGAGNLRGRLSASSRVTGKGVGVSAGNGLDLTIDGSAVTSDGFGVAAGNNPHVRIVGDGSLRGEQIALASGENLDLTLERGAIRSPATAVCGKHNGHISSRGGSIEGAVALHFERAPDEQFFGTTITGARTVDALGCGALPAVALVTPAQRKSPIGTVRAPAPTPPSPAAGPAFDATAAVIALDAATRAASAQCRSSSGRPETTFVSAGFSPDGRNSGAIVGGKLAGTIEASCVERVFRGVSIPPFDPATRPSGLGRSVELK